MRKAFTLIEVMVSVSIISIVIMTLLKMNGNSSKIFFNVKEKVKINQYASFIIASDKYGFEDKNINLYEFTKDINPSFALKKQLKNTKVKISYNKLDTISFTTSLEVGKTVLKIGDDSVSLVRLSIK